MSELIVSERQNIVNIANAIRDKIGNTKKITIGEMVGAINSIQINGGIDTSDATASAENILLGETAYVNGVKVTGTIPSKDAATITPNNNSQVAISAGTYASGDITVGAVPTMVKDITENGTYTPEEGKYFSSVSVNIPSESFDTQSKAIAPSETQQVITPDNGYDGL